MMVAAIPPNMASNSNGSIPRIVVPEAMATGTIRLIVALITALRGSSPCPLIGRDGNIYNLMGIASRTLKQNGMREQAKEMCERITSSKNYYEALNILGEYVNITSVAAEDEALDEASEGPEIR